MARRTIRSLAFFSSAIGTGLVIGNLAADPIVKLAMKAAFDFQVWARNEGEGVPYMEFEPIYSRISPCLRGKLPVKATLRNVKSGRIEKIVVRLKITPTFPLKSPPVSESISGPDLTPDLSGDMHLDREYRLERGNHYIALQLLDKDTGLRISAATSTYAFVE